MNKLLFLALLLFNVAASSQVSTNAIVRANDYFDDGGTAKLTFANRNGSILYGIVDTYTNEPVTFTHVIIKPNGVSYTDADIDGVIVRKKGVEYFKRNVIGNIDARWYGIQVNVDATTKINKALLNIDKKWVEVTGGTYLINGVADGIQMQSGTKLILPNKTDTLKVITNSADVYSAIAIRNKTNVTIEGNGVIYGERDAHTGSTGEYGMGITIDQSSYVTIRGVEIRKMWGDGIYVGGGVTATQPKEILIENVISDSNRRQGISLTNVKNIRIVNSKFRYTNGTAPQAGMDLENNSGGSIENVYVTNCDFSNNGSAGGGSGINGYGAYSNGFMKNIHITGGNISNNVYDGIGISTIYDIHSDFYIDGSKIDSNGHDAIAIERTVNLNVSNVKALNTLGLTTMYAGNITGGTLRDSRFSSVNPSGSGIGFVGVVTNFSLINNNFSTFNTAVGSSNVGTIKGLKIIGGRYRAINAEGIFLYNATNSTIATTLSDSCGSYGIRINGGGGNIITNNTIFGASTLTNNVYHGIYIEGSSTNNDISSNIFKSSLGANQIRNAIALASGTSTNKVTNNDFTNANAVTGNISDAGTDNTVIDNMYRSFGSTANRPTNPPLNWRYLNTDTYIFEYYYGAGWAKLNYVGSAGAGHSATDLTNLSGTLSQGSVVTQVFTGSPTGSPSGVSAGQVFTFNGFDNEGTFSFLESRIGAQVYIQHYNSSGVGQGWGVPINQGATETAIGVLRIATQTETDAGSSDFLGVTPLKLKNARSFRLVGSATLDFPSTASGVAADLTITVTGAAVGDAVSLGVPNVSITATSTWFAWVSATNTVTVRFIPHATENPASGTFTVDVLK